jgi:hypothetical protein
MDMTKTGTPNGWETTIANHLEQSFRLPMRDRELQSDHIYCTLLWHVLGSARPFTSLRKQWKNAGSKLFCRAKPACLDFSSSNFNLQGHILSTSGVALRTCQSFELIFNQFCDWKLENSWAQIWAHLGGSYIYIIVINWQPLFLSFSSTEIYMFVISPAR